MMMISPAEIKYCSIQTWSNNKASVLRYTLSLNKLQSRQHAAAAIPAFRQLKC